MHVAATFAALRVPLQRGTHCASSLTAVDVAQQIIDTEAAKVLRLLVKDGHTEDVVLGQDLPVDRVRQVRLHRVLWSSTTIFSIAIVFNANHKRKDQACESSAESTQSINLHTSVAALMSVHLFTVANPCALPSNSEHRLVLLRKSLTCGSQQQQSSVDQQPVACLCPGC